MSRGMTLLELLISVSILMLLLALVTPEVNGVYQQYRTRKAISDVLALFMEARTQALFKRSPVWLFLISDASQGSEITTLLLSDASPYHSTSEIYRYSAEGFFLSATFSELEFSSLSGFPNQGGHLSLYAAGRPEYVFRIIFHNITGRADKYRET